MNALAVVGNTAAVHHIGNWTDSFELGYVVTKVTPSGQVTIEREVDGVMRSRRFDKNGKEMGGVFGTHYVRFDVEEVKRIINLREFKQTAANALNAVKVTQKVNPLWAASDFRQSVAELEKLLAVAKAAVEAIPEIQ